VKGVFTEESRTLEILAARFKFFEKNFPAESENDLERNDDSRF